MEQQKSMKELGSLPNDILLAIFEFLTIEDIVLGLRQTCKAWNKLSYDKMLWRVIDFSKRGEEATDDFVLSLLKDTQKHVKVLNFSECDNLSGEVIFLQDVHCPLLKEMHIADLVKFDEDKFYSLIPNFFGRYPGLQVLHLPFFPNILYPSLDFLIPWKNLKKLGKNNIIAYGMISDKE